MGQDKSIRGLRWMFVKQTSSQLTILRQKNQLKANGWKTTTEHNAETGVYTLYKRR